MRSSKKNSRHKWITNDWARTQVHDILASKYAIHFGRCEYKLSTDCNLIHFEMSKTDIKTN